MNYTLYFTRYVDLCLQTGRLYVARFRLFNSTKLTANVCPLFIIEWLQRPFGKAL